MISFIGVAYRVKEKHVSEVETSKDTGVAL